MFQTTNQVGIGGMAEFYLVLVPRSWIETLFQGTKFHHQTALKKTKHIETHTHTQKKIITPKKSWQPSAITKKQNLPQVSPSDFSHSFFTSQNEKRKTKREKMTKKSPSDHASQVSGYRRCPFWRARRVVSSSRCASQLWPRRSVSFRSAWCPGAKPLLAASNLGRWRARLYSWSSWSFVINQTINS